MCNTCGNGCGCNNNSGTIFGLDYQTIIIIACLWFFCCQGGSLNCRGGCGGSCGCNPTPRYDDCCC